MSNENFHVGSPPTAPNPTGTRKKRMWLGIAAMAAVVVVAFCCGLSIGGGDTDPQVITTPTPVKVIEYLPAPSAPAPTADASPAAPTKAPAATIDDGVWTVGEDFPAGTYKVTAAVTQMCYWGIYKSGTNQENIIQNDIVTGGRPTVTLKRGQDFKTSDCGTWIKVK